MIDFSQVPPGTRLWDHELQEYGTVSPYSGINDTRPLVTVNFEYEIRRYDSKGRRGDRQGQTLFFAKPVIIQKSKPALPVEHKQTVTLCLCATSGAPILMLKEQSRNFVIVAETSVDVVFEWYPD